MSYFLSFGNVSGQNLRITVNGEIYGTYSLLEDRTVDIRRGGHENTVRIAGGAVSMTGSDCHGQDCVHQHSISLSGETIVCLPNRVILEITGGDKAYDAISE